MAGLLGRLLEDLGGLPGGVGGPTGVPLSQLVGRLLHGLRRLIRRLLSRLSLSRRLWLVQRPRSEVAGDVVQLGCQVLGGCLEVLLTGLLTSHPLGGGLLQTFELLGQVGLLLGQSLGLLGERRAATVPGIVESAGHFLSGLGGLLGRLGCPTELAGKALLSSPSAEPGHFRGLLCRRRFRPVSLSHLPRHLRRVLGELLLLGLRLPGIGTRLVPSLHR